MEPERKRVDPVSLVGGVSIAAIGVLLALDQSGDLELSAGALAAAFVGLFGLIILVSGLLDD